MPNDMTAEQAMKIATSVTGKEGLVAVRSDLKKAIENKKLQIAAAQGELSGLVQMERLLGAMEIRWGLAAAPETPASSTSSTKAPALAENPELVQRLEAGFCTFKDRNPPNGTGKWCERKLKTKAEKECGFCQTHQTALGVISGAEK